MLSLAACIGAPPTWRLWQPPSRTCVVALSCPQASWVLTSQLPLLLAEQDCCQSVYLPAHLLCVPPPSLFSVYFIAQASHLSHLARKLEAAVGDAMRLSTEARAKMIAEALAKRFPAEEMMSAYGNAWAEVRMELHP